MNKKVILLIMLALTGMVFMSACIEQPIKSQQDVVKTVENVSSSVDKITGILEDVDKTLGGV